MTEPSTATPAPASDPLPAGDPAPDSSPCTHCGACCATYRVSFYWGEAPQLGLPGSLYEALSAWHACMRGTASAPMRCVAQAGGIGQSVACTVYAQRPSPCRELQAGDDRCQRARARHGLAAL